MREWERECGWAHLVDQVGEIADDRVEDQLEHIQDDLRHVYDHHVSIGKVGEDAHVRDE